MKPVLILAILLCTGAANCKSVKKAILEEQPSKGTTYYVDPNGRDNNKGTEPTTAWKTLGKINTRVFLPGDKILLKSGSVWNETLILKGSGAEGAPIVVDKFGGDTKPIINGGGKTNNSTTVLLDKGSYWEINNLEVTNTVPDNITYAATGIKVSGGGKFEKEAVKIAIKNCYVHDVNAATAKQTNYIKGTGGIIINGKVNDLLVQGCHIANCSVEGLRTTGFSEMEHRSSNVVFNNNLIENIYGDGIVMSQVSGGSKVTNNTVYNACMTNDINFAGIWTVASKNTVVAFNEVYGMKGGGPNDGMAFDADGWDEPSTTEGDIFEYNYSHDNNGGFMLFMSYAKNITVRYNVSINDVGATGAKKLFLIQDSPNKDRFVYNNVFVIKNPVDKLFWEGSGAVFSNNIFYTESAINKFSDKTPDSRTRFVNNCFYPETAFGNLIWGSAERNNNFYGNPLFKNPVLGSGRSSASGYSISVNSPCRGAGIAIPNNGGKDFLGTALPGVNPDVGAFQYSASGTAGSFLKK